MNRGVTNKEFLLILLVTVEIFVIGVSIIGPFIPDDSFISFRYAEHLAQGSGLRFNDLGAPVEGYSNFLWIIICALLSLFSPLPQIAPLAGEFLGGLCIIMLGVLLRRSAGNWLEIALPLAFLSVSGPFLLYSASGMETPLFILLIIATMWGAEIVSSSRSFFGRVFLGFLAFATALTRPEGIVVYPLILVGLGLHRIQPSQHKNKPSGNFITNHLISIAIFFAAVAIYNIWRFHYFGALLPTPFTSKGGWDERIVNGWITNLRYFFNFQNDTYAPSGYYYAVFLSFAAIQLWHTRYDRKYWSPACSISISLVLGLGAVYLNFVDWMPAQRYYVPLIVPLLIISSPLFGRLKKEVVAIAIAPALFISLFMIAELKIDARSTAQSTDMSLVALGKWLRESVPRTSLLAMSDIGATPYYSKLPTLDINPRSLTDRYIAEHGFSARYVLEKMPDIIILVSFSLTRPQVHSDYVPLLRDSTFLDEYRLVGVSRYDWNHDRCYWVYLRNNISLTQAQHDKFPKGFGSS